MKSCASVSSWIVLALTVVGIGVFVLVSISSSDSARFQASSKPVAVATRNPRMAVMLKLDQRFSPYQADAQALALGARDKETLLAMDRMLRSVAGVSLTQRERSLFPRTFRMLEVFRSSCVLPSNQYHGESYELVSCIQDLDAILGLALAESEGR